jgi:hypothetical protein
MEGLTRLVSESLARHGFDRPLDYRRLRWSRWFRCDSHHSLLAVPSKPGVFAVAEEIMDFGSNVEEPRFSAASGTNHIAALAAAGVAPEAGSRTPEAASPRRMLAVTQFFEDDDMAFVLDRMLSRQNPMAARLASGRYFVRFVVIEDETQRRSICSALNQWMVSASEKATGIGSHFATSLELTPATEYNPQADERQQSLFSNEENVSRAPSPATADATDTHVAADAFVRPPARSTTESVWGRVSDPVGPSAARQDFAGTTDARVATGASEACPEPSRRAPRSEASGVGTKHGFPAPAPVTTAPHLNSGAAANIHCPSPFPSGF